MKTRERHLSAEVLFECVMAGPTVPQRAHLNECAVCADEMRRNEMAAIGVRNAASKWAESRQGSDAAFLKRLVKRQRQRRELRFAQLTAAVLLVLLVPGALVEQRRGEQKRRQADEVLLQQVDDEIAERVPTAMQPLTGLMTWQEDSEQATGSAQARNN